VAEFTQKHLRCRGEKFRCLDVILRLVSVFAPIHVQTRPQRWEPSSVSCCSCCSCHGFSSHGVPLKPRFLVEIKEKRRNTRKWESVCPQTRLDNLKGLHNLLIRTLFFPTNHELTGKHKKIDTHRQRAARTHQMG